jgi:DNA gyrase subunit A
MPPLPPLNIETELRDSYLTYAMSVIISRALPDVRDGLKPSQRRILVAMNDLGLSPTAKTSKCAGIVGETMKRYHPHGDNSIYPTLVRMAQDWNMRHRLVHGQGNFGSVAGLPPAAHRYTEARLTPVAAELLADLEFDTVDFIDNYDGSYREPLVLPGKFPNLLVNGADGIAVGMATEIPPHNLKEVCLATIKVIDDPNVSLLELLEVLPGPDFPTGGIIMGRQGILDGYSKGRGKITLRARADIIQEGKTTQILIKEVPYQQNRIRLAEVIAELVKDERIKGIASMRDESSARTGEPVRLVIDLKRDADAVMVLNQLYQYSPLQRTVSLIMLALVDGRPRLLGIKEMIDEFLRHRLNVLRRRTEHKLREAKKRGHVLEGQLIAISSIEEVIQICRTAPSRAEAKERLRNLAVAPAVLERALGAEAFTALQRELGTLASYSMTEQQADAVVRLQLGQLANLERDEILKEYNGLRTEITTYETLLSDNKNLLAIIRADLTELANKYGDQRRTEISGADGDIDLEALIEEAPNAVSISHKQFIKRMPLSVYRMQNRGGKGVSAGVREEDVVEHFFVANTHAYLLCFTNRGQMYWLRVFDIPEVKNRTNSGRHLGHILTLKPDEQITSVIPVRRFEGNFCLLMATQQGTIKKTPLVDYSRPRTAGIIGITLDEGDTLVDVVLVQPGDEVMLATRQGMSIRFDESDARPMGRNARGVRGITLQKGDELVGMVVADPLGFLLTVCEKGYGKRTPFGPNTSGQVSDEAEESAEVAEEPDTTEANGEDTPTSAMRYRKQRRGGKGVRDIRCSDRNGQVVTVTSVREGDQLLVMTAEGMTTRSAVEQIRIVGRNTQGVRIMNLAETDRVVSLAKVAQEDAGEPDPVPAVE